MPLPANWSIRHFVPFECICKQNHLRDQVSAIIKGIPAAMTHRGNTINQADNQMIILFSGSFYFNTAVDTLFTRGEDSLPHSFSDLDKLVCGEGRFVFVQWPSHKI